MVALDEVGAEVGDDVESGAGLDAFDDEGFAEGFAERDDRRDEGAVVGVLSEARSLVYAAERGRTRSCPRARERHAADSFFASRGIRGMRTRWSSKLTTPIDIGVHSR